MNQAFPLPTIRHDGTTVQCSNCKHTFPPDTTWRCPHCSNRAVFGMQPHTCTNCRQPTNAVRSGYQVRSLCLCHLTTAELVAKQRDLSKRHVREQREAQDEKRHQKAIAAQINSRNMATKCWDDFEHVCTVRKDNLPFEHCPLCPRFD